MKSYSADLLALLASGLPCYRVDLFAIGPCRNGSYIYATNGQLPVVFGGNTYHSAQFGSWSRGDVTVKIGIESNSTQLTVFADNQIPVYFPGTSNTILLLDGIKFGLLGKVKVTVYTAYMPDYGVVTGPTGGSLVEIKFVGEVGPIEPIGMTKAIVDVRDMMYILNEQVPGRVFQASCSHVVYDAGCTLNPATFTKTGTVGAVTYPYLFTTTAHLTPTSAAGTFAQGLLIWTSGANSGLSSFVRAWSPGSTDAIQLDVQPISPIQVGDTFQVRQGCNQTFVSCTDLQGATNAKVNFGGQPYTPVPETAI